MEAASLAVGVAALASLFNNAVDCFEYVQIGRNYGKASQTSILRLDLARLKLTRWGKSIGIANINEARSLEQTQLQSHDIAQAEQLLGQILQVFADAEIVSRRTEQNSLPSGEGELGMNANTPDSTLHQKMRKLCLQRQGKAGLRQKVKWALSTQKHLTRMVEDINELVNSLIELFPAAAGVQQQLCEAEVSEIGTGSQLSALAKEADKHDNLLSETIAKTQESLSTYTASATISGDNYGGIQIGNNPGQIGDISLNK